MNFVYFEWELIIVEVVIGVIYLEMGCVFILVSEDMVFKMKFGVVIVDVSID